jgi:hypothetical protein
LTYLEHDLGHEGPTRPVTTQRTPAGGPAAPMLDLQRLAGNAAVSQAIKSGRFDSDVPVQRLDDDTETTEDTEEESSEDEDFQDTGEVADQDFDEDSSAEEEETESETEE